MLSLPAFLAAYPAIEIDLVKSAAAADLIESGLDLAIHIVEKPEPHLVVRRIATSRVVIVVSPGYLAFSQNTKSSSEISWIIAWSASHSSSVKTSVSR